MAIYVKESVSPSGLWFSIMVEGEEYLAFVYSDALRTCFQVPGQVANDRALYTANQVLIDHVAMDRFMQGQSRPIRLTVAELEKAKADYLNQNGLTSGDE